MNKRYELLLQVAQIDGNGTHTTSHGLAHTQGIAFADALSLCPLSSFEKYYFLTIAKKEDCQGSLSLSSLVLRSRALQ
jgi:hypothetical protein